jgi:hypothetical protein
VAITGGVPISSGACQHRPRQRCGAGGLPAESGMAASTTARLAGDALAVALGTPAVQAGRLARSTLVVPWAWLLIRQRHRA